MDCGAVGKTSIANGNIVPPANTLYGAVAKLTCNQGYYLQFLYLPAAEIHCLGPPAKWNASFDDCKCKLLHLSEHCSSITTWTLQCVSKK